MTEERFRQEIQVIHGNMDALLLAGDRESLLKLVAYQGQLPQWMFRKDEGLRQVANFCGIWQEEVAHGEESIFIGVRSVQDIVEKARLIRLALFRLENDFPHELCIQALQILTEYNISPRTFAFFKQNNIEDGEKVIARIAEVTASFSAG